MSPQAGDFVGLKNNAEAVPSLFGAASLFCYGGSERILPVENEC